MGRQKSPQVQENLDNIAQYIELSQHKYPNGITSSSMFSGVVKDPEGIYYPSDIKCNDPRYTQYVSTINRYAKFGYMKHKQLEPNKPKVWVVLSDAERHEQRQRKKDLTGVKNSPIANFKAPATTPVVMPPTTPDLEAIKHEAKEEIYQELKSIWVNGAQLKLPFAMSSFKNVSLYSLYQAGKALSGDMFRLAKIKAEQEKAEESPATPVEEAEEDIPEETDAPF